MHNLQYGRDTVEAVERINKHLGFKPAVHLDYNPLMGVYIRGYEPEFENRHREPKINPKVEIPDTAWAKLISDLRDLLKDEHMEHVHYIYLDDDYKIIDRSSVDGEKTSAHTDRREVFKNLYKFHAKNLIMCHNHPSSDVGSPEPSPSPVDFLSTMDLSYDLKKHDYDLVDHIVVSNIGCSSVRTMLKNFGAPPWGSEFKIPPLAAISRL